MVSPIIELTSESDICTLKLNGDAKVRMINPLWLGNIRKELRLVETHSLVIDLAGVETLDMGSLKLLLKLQQDFSRKDIQIVLQNPNSRLRKLFNILQFDQFFVVNFIS